MLLGWIRKGLRTGIVTTSYPAQPESMPPNFRGRPVLDAARCEVKAGCTSCVEICPTNALRVEPIADGHGPQRVVLDYARCIMCGLCVPACPHGALTMSNEYELATRRRTDLEVIVTEA
jgi:formate hydrogenlyase subunit 6/NADH:ubiquinone oxidoreductase subunit I